MNYRLTKVTVLCISVALLMLVRDRLTTPSKKNDKFMGTRYLAVPIKHEQEFLDVRATRWISDEAFHRYLTSPDVTCNNSFRAGKIDDGGWDVCLTEPFHLKPPCLVYSFGINYDYSFDDAIAKTFECTVKAFDPSMKKVSNHKRGKHIHFFKEGISGKDFKDKRGWNLYSLATLVKTQNDSERIIDYFKMDVEGAEWDALPDMAVTGTIDNIKQIGIEIHRTKRDLKIVHLIDILEDHGFRKWKIHYNFRGHGRYKMSDGNVTSAFIEMYYINTRFIESRQINNFLLR